MSSLVLVGGKKRTVKRRGRGLGGDVLGAVGSWAGKQIGNRIQSMLGFGRKTKKRAVRRRGGIVLTGSMGGRKKRVGGKVVIPDMLKPSLSYAKEYLLEKGKGLINDKIREMYGFGRKKRVVRRRGGRVYSRLLL